MIKYLKESKSTAISWLFKIKVQYIFEYLNSQQIFLQPLNVPACQPTPFQDTSTEAVLWPVI